MLRSITSSPRLSSLCRLAKGTDPLRHTDLKKQTQFGVDNFRGHWPGQGLRQHRGAARPNFTLQPTAAFIVKG